MKKWIRALLDSTPDVTGQKQLAGDGEKMCSECGPQPVGNFYRLPTSQDGLMGICKGCHKARMRDRSKTHRAVIRVYEREKRRRPKYRKMDREWARRHPERSNAMKARWAAKNPDKCKAEWTVGNALRDGRMVKPKRCQRCGRIPKSKPGQRNRIEAHHPDYSKPLEVEWLCTKCHGETRIKENAQT